MSASCAHVLYHDLGTNPALIVPRIPDRHRQCLNDGGAQPSIDIMQGFLDGRKLKDWLDVLV